MMQAKLTVSNMISWILGLLVFTIGILNLILIHPVPGIVGLLLSFVFFPPVNELLVKRFGFSIPFAVKIILAPAIFWFTLGISELGELIDQLAR